jgi:uncharacterized protein YhfF
MADELGALVVSGVKTATCSSVWELEHSDNPTPFPGMLTIILDGKHAPICVIETLSVETVRYQDVSASFAFAEGEGDRTLEYWRRVHWEYFSRVLPKLGYQATPDMPVVCERFRILSSAREQSKTDGSGS